LWVEYEVLGPHVNVTGRSSDLLFALALITSKWKTNGRYPAIAATGMLDADSATLSGEAASAVHGVKHTVEKLAAAVSSFVNEPEAVVSYPEADAESVTTWSASANVPAQLRLHPVKDLEDALSFRVFASRRCIWAIHFVASSILIIRDTGAIGARPLRASLRAKA
jgi:hypothetical protein